MARSATDDLYTDDDGGQGGSLAEQLDLQYYLRILRKHKWPITLFTGAVTALAAYYAFTATPIYSATSTLLIESQRANLVSIEELVGGDSENQDYYQTQFELLRSRGLARRVIDKLDLWNHPELSLAARESAAREAAGQRAVLGEPATGLQGFVDSVKGKVAEVTGNDAGDAAQGDAGAAELSESAEAVVDLASGTATGTDGASLGATASGTMPDLKLDLENFGANEGDVLTTAEQFVVGNFMQHLSISPVRKTKLVKISYESADPVLAASVANTVGEQYITSYLDAKLELTTKASSWLNERLQTLKATLDESEDRLIAFKEANGLVDVDGSVGRLNEQELLLVTAELAQARSELASQADMYREVQSLRNRPELLESLPAIQADPLVQRVKIEQGQAQRQLDELLNRYGERHPRVVDVKSQLATLNTTLQGHLNRVVGSISSNYNLTRSRVASIEAKLAAGKQDIQAIGTKKFELDALVREVGTNQNIYDQFFSRMTEAKSADGLESANARVSDFAVPPVRPVKPKKQLIIALAALSSLVLSMLMAFLYEQMDDTIKSTNDIEGRLGLKLLGILPLVKNGLFDRGRSLPLNPADIPDKRGTFAESVNTARTALCLDDGDSQRKIFMVTSSVPGEGKSTASINLAYSLAQLERVLLIDCDMRRPTIAKAAGFDRNETGLSNLITNTATARECIKRGAFDGQVDILPSGPIPEQPLELLASKRFEKILEQLTKHYDRIVIDSAPTQAVSDALVLSRVADAVVYIVKSHDTSIELVRRGVQRLKQVSASLAGVLITQVDIDKITSYGGDYYYQGYYDYYGYTEKGERGTKRRGKMKLTQEELQNIKTDDREVELDLDHGLSRHANEPSSANAVMNSDGLDEFDLTAQVDSATVARLGRQRPEVAASRGGSSNNLDTDIL